MTGDTIAALCTAQGKAALSVLRLSGPQALLIARSVAGFLPQKPESHKAYFGLLKNKGYKLDEVLLTYFEKGRSFTGEETVEISCHGGEVYKDILSALIEEGARPAKRGEFSLQALSNGKMDLTQAEGLLQLIESESHLARIESLKQLKGELSKKLLKIEEKWLSLLSHISADIDFSLENLNTLSQDQIQTEIQKLLKEVSALISSYHPFDRLQKGLVFGIFGPVNVGKSSLFNALLDQEKAIVSDEEGTTRDIVEAQILNPEGLNILLKDSAGFRESESDGEKKGQKKALGLFKECDCRMIVIDISKLIIPLTKRGSVLLELLEKDLFQALKSLSPPEKNWLIFTKTDLLDKIGLEEIKNQILSKKKSLLQENATKIEEVFFVSSLSQSGLSSLKEKMLTCGNINQEDCLITNSRHFSALKTMKNSLKSCQKQPEGEKQSQNLSLDIMALNLQEGLMALYEILGKELDDKVLDQVFEKFCIGK